QQSQGQIVRLLLIHHCRPEQVAQRSVDGGIKLPVRWHAVDLYALPQMHHLRELSSFRGVFLTAIAQAVWPVGQLQESETAQDGDCENWNSTSFPGTFLQASSCRGNRSLCFS